MYQARVEAPCRATERGERVKAAILNIFPEAQLAEGHPFVGEAGSLRRFAELLRTQRIRDSARELLIGAIRDDQLVFYLNKQAAYAGKVSFSAYAPLGDICVTVTSDRLRDLVEELAPPVRRRGRGEARSAP